jgi:hypothetical protein
VSELKLSSNDTCGTARTWSAFPCDSHEKGTPFPAPPKEMPQQLSRVALWGVRVVE